MTHRYFVTCARSTTRLLFVSFVFMACATKPLTRDDPIAGNDGFSVNALRACRVTNATALDGKAARPPVVTRCLLPRYPDQLRRNGVGGDAIVEFLVDSAGRPDHLSLRVVRASEFAFADAVGRSVPYIRFEPMQPGESRPVLVQMLFRFDIAR